MTPIQPLTNKWTSGNAAKLRYHWVCQKQLELPCLETAKQAKKTAKKGNRIIPTLSCRPRSVYIAANIASKTLVGTTPGWQRLKSEQRPSMSSTYWALFWCLKEAWRENQPSCWDQFGIHPRGNLHNTFCRRSERAASIWVGHFLRVPLFDREAKGHHPFLRFPYFEATEGTTKPHAGRSRSRLLCSQ